jgi:hypothetical protein
LLGRQRISAELSQAFVERYRWYQISIDHLFDSHGTAYEGGSFFENSADGSK